ncbi:ATUPS5 [Arabidopsis lyrata subsp. lyrata]|uniref:ATUPS5 n=1 Tax=Arabidopsis lyrata subsp. lyrata TaxID=81972 RepID=D7KQQ6_ARALL|nr:ureide permease 5 isoform X1 [Arabidopsis lyrata subsp. lyrata]EFH66917.1 ATUPS5 [Arabidopsis lyrata subsp. lyrata]|eukprot:XP_002890658.1 ureide permease 5 isoform X1 [Arabidopsis lyrata subsp. lyrata]
MMIAQGLGIYVVESKGGAIFCILLSLLCLGTWPALMALLERRGRLPQHTYLDYSITNFLAAIFIAFVFGGLGESTHEAPSFITQLTQIQDNWPSVLFAMAGGVGLSIGNLATQYSLAFVGLSVTEVTTASITVVVGTTVNYFLDNRLNRADILFSGVGCFLVAVCLGSAVHSSNSADIEAKLGKLSGDCETVDTEECQRLFGVEEEEKEMENVKEGTAAFLIALENTRAIKVFGKSMVVGLGITFFAGLCFSLFSPLFNLATNDQWHGLKQGVPKLIVYTAFFYFSLSCFVIAVALNISFLYKPVLDSPRSSFKEYLSDWNGRGWALAAGLFCGFGNGLQFMGGQAAGYAASDAVQALPLVSTFWGIYLFGEYRRSSPRTYALLVGMLVMFTVAVGLLMASAGERETRFT